MINAMLFVIVHTIPMLDGLTEIQGEDFVHEPVCKMRVYILNRFDPSNFYYECKEVTK